MNTGLRVYKVLCLLLGALVVCSCATTPELTSLAGLEQAINLLSPKIILIKDFPVLAQPNRYTCGITTVAVVSSFFNESNLSACGLIEKHHVDTTHGASVAELQGWLRSELPSHNTKYHKNESNSRMLGEIHECLAAGRPVVVVFGSPSPYAGGLYDFHFSTVYGMDLIKKTITISNAYGYMEEIPLVDFLNRMSFSEIRKYPPALQEVIRRGIDKNQIVIME